MWSEKRGIEGFIFLGVFPIVINIVTNLVYLISGCRNSVLEIVNQFNNFTIFSIFICCLFNFLTPEKRLSGEEKEKLKKEMNNMKLLNIFFITYIVFAVFIMKNTSIIISSIIMEIAYINCYRFKMKSKSVIVLSETQKNWRKFYNRYAEEESNILWRVKPMLYPHIDVSFSKRIKFVNWISVVFIVLSISNISLESASMIIIIIILMFSEILYLIDMILGLYTKTEGICTGIVRKEKTKGGRRIYYEIYVTNFESKREIIFRQYDYCAIREMDEIKVIHGSLSKRFIELE